MAKSLLTKNPKQCDIRIFIAGHWVKVVDIKRHWSKYSKLAPRFMDHNINWEDK